jgi:hypothetical protein
MFIVGELRRPDDVKPDAEGSVGGGAEVLSR